VNAICFILLSSRWPLLEPAPDTAQAELAVWQTRISKPGRTCWEVMLVGDKKDCGCGAKKEEKKEEKKGCDKK
jgi:hypothetical protein